MDKMGAGSCCDKVSWTFCRLAAAQGGGQREGGGRFQPPQAAGGTAPAGLGDRGRVGVVGVCGRAAAENALLSRISAKERGLVTIVKGWSKSSTLSSTPVTVTTCGTFHAFGSPATEPSVNVSMAGSTVASAVLELVRFIVM